MFDRQIIMWPSWLGRTRREEEKRPSPPLEAKTRTSAGKSFSFGVLWMLSKGVRQGEGGKRDENDCLMTFISEIRGHSVIRTFASHFNYFVCWKHSKALNEAQYLNDPSENVDSRASANFSAPQFRQLVIDLSTFPRRFFNRFRVDFFSSRFARRELENFFLHKSAGNPGWVGEGRKKSVRRVK